MTADHLLKGTARHSITSASATDEQRLAALQAYHILDTGQENDFDELTALASAICNTPVALISLLDRDRQWFKSHHGTAETETPLAYSFCAHAVTSPGQVMIVPDATQDTRFANNPLVTGEPHIAFYAGVPLVNQDGIALGSLCVIDTKTRVLSAEQTTALSILGKQVMDRLELRRKVFELEKTNKRLLESENRFEQLLNHVPVAIATYTGRDMIIEQANAEMLAIWGRDESVIGQPLLVARPEIANHPYLKILDQTFTSGNEHQGLAIQGPVFYKGQITEGYYDVVYKPIKNTNGQVTGIIVITNNVTEKTLARRREDSMNEELIAMNEELTASNEELIDYQQDLLLANDNLSESESRFRTLIKQSPVAIATLVGEELIIDCVNDMILQIWGKSESVVGKPLHIGLPELEGQPFLQLLDDVYTSGKAFYGYEIKAKLGHPEKLTDRFLNFVYHPIKGEGNITKEILVVATDVTEQVNIRKRVEETSQRLEIALEAGSMGSSDIELSTGNINCNVQCKKNYGLNKDDIFNFPTLLNAVLPEYRQYVQEQFNTAIAHKKTYHAEYQIKWPDDSIHWITAYGTPCYDDKGNALRMIGVSKDITQNKLFEQQKDDFLSIASHELKTPVTSLKASLQLLNVVKNKPSTPLHIKLIEQANRSMEKMSALIDDLLNVNRMDSGHLHLDKTMFTLAEMLNSCCNHVRMAGEHELILQGDENLKIYADENRIEQVVVNFVNNAVKYAPDSKKIYLIIEQTNNAAKISVRDTGPGIAAAKQPYLFDRYYRASHSGKAYTGLGLGLYICAEIIKRHGGQIGVDSEIGKGSNFWFTLPLNS